ncbi:XRE family transcriptional regulator [Lactococcus nasutitermitis]|uniref:XRE family transcriptional regulator n=1 Tax=Lactococcus nasutitermitis TaxID=1652957 RepID=A0ABV9JEN4_9LACT|nr:XRE family transcriptional regulator [Lactococcus nasutitermitis]
MTEFNLLSPEMERALIDTIDKRFEQYDKARDKIVPLDDIIPQAEVCNRLDIDYLTLQEWEKQGLPRYEPPYKSRKVFYLKADIRKFLGMQ